MKRFVLKPVGVNNNVLGKRTVDRHAENGVFDRLHFGIGPPIDVGIDNNCFAYPVVIFFVTDFFYDASAIGTECSSEADVGILAFAYPIIATVERSCFDLY